VAWWREPLPFLRAVTLDLGIVKERRRIMISTDQEGRPVKQYEFDVVERPRERPGLMVVGEPSEMYSPSNREFQAEARRKELAIAASLGLQWFDDPSEAEEKIRTLIGRARKSVMILDPYFGPQELASFGLATSPEVEVRIVTSANCLRQRSGAGELGDQMDGLLEQLSRENFASVSMLIMPGETPELHDRFIVVDGRVWFTGNSLNAIGSRASVLIEIPNPQYVLSHLKPIVSAAKPFHDWIKERRESRANRDDAN
jgi:hypothetical protein